MEKVGGRTLKIQQTLRDRLAQFFERYAEPEYDLWRGGRSKANLLTAAGAQRLTAASPGPAP